MHKREAKKFSEMDSLDYLIFGLSGMNVKPSVQFFMKWYGMKQADAIEAYERYQLYIGGNDHEANNR